MDSARYPSDLNLGASILPPYHGLILPYNGVPIPMNCVPHSGHHLYVQNPPCSFIPRYEHPFQTDYYQSQPDWDESTRRDDALSLVDKVAKSDSGSLTALGEQKSLMENQCVDHLPREIIGDGTKPLEGVATVADGMWIGGPPQTETPMNRLSRLGRFNRITLKYELLDEKGPAHCKMFHSKVSFKINGQLAEYFGEGSSIKAASHNAAVSAVQNCTALRSPPDKSPTSQSASLNSSYVSRVNFMAAKYKSWADYQDYRQPVFPFGPVYWGTNLFVCGKSFSGCGESRMCARNNAAKTALNYFENSTFPKLTLNVAAARRDRSLKNVALKGPICLLYEKAKRSGQEVLFEVENVDGPPHCQIHEIKCVLGDLESFGEGSNKKEAKHRAAENMLKLMDGAALFENPATPTESVDYKARINPLKVSKARPEYGKNINPVSRLCQLQQAKNAPDPVYEIKVADGPPGNAAQEFVATVCIAGYQPVSGTATSKKLAKRFAAENFLRTSGVAVQSLAPQKSNLKSNDGEAPGLTEKSDRKVSFDVENLPSEDKQNGPSYRRRFVKYPRPQTLYPNESVEESLVEASGTGVDKPGLAMSGLSVIAKELLCGSTSLFESIKLEIDDLCPGREKDISCFVEYLCRLAHASLKRETFAKQGPHGEFVTVLTAGDPIESIGCGGGATKEVAANDAARNLLNVIAEQGDVIQICAEKNRLADSTRSPKE